MSQVAINILGLLGGIWAMCFISFMALWGLAAWSEKRSRK